ncbi:MAG: GntR family transcriptional regulator [Egibacteraceae bacterium]
MARIRAWILTHELPAGTRLNQSLLAERLGVSRIPVRDALRSLTGEGLVELAERGGAIVTGLSVPDLQELYELREAVEPLASRLAVPNVGRAQLLTMNAWMEEMDAADDRERWLTAHARFHVQVYGQSGRPRMVALVENLRQQAERYLRLLLGSGDHMGHLREEHGQILAAVGDADAPRVEAVTRRHLEMSHEFILGHLLERDVTHGTLNLKGGVTR